jgi:putative membrane protein
MRRITMMLYLAALGACQNAPPPGPPVPPVDLNSPLFAPRFLEVAASSGQFEIQSSQLALQMSQNPGVRTFAQRMITDHSQMSSQMAAAASSAGLMTPPPALLPEHQAVLDQLRAAGPNFDLAYKDAQVNGHGQALTVMQNYASGGDVPALRSAAADAVPMIQSHLAMAQSLVVSAALPPPPPPPQPMPHTGERG